MSDHPDDGPLNSVGASHTGPPSDQTPPVSRTESSNPDTTTEPQSLAPTPSPHILSHCGDYVARGTTVGSQHTDSYMKSAVPAPDQYSHYTDVLVGTYPSSHVVGTNLMLIWDDLDQSGGCQPGMSAMGIGFIANNCLPCGDGGGDNRYAVSTGMRLMWATAGPATPAVSACNKALVCVALDLRWDGTHVVGAEIDSVWATAQLAGNSRSFPWSVLFGWPVDATMAVLWDTAPATWGNSLTTGWDNHITVGSESDLSWDSLSIIGQERDLSWDDYKIIGVEEELVWYGNGVVGSELDLFYNDYTTVHRDASAFWNVTTTVGADTAVTWDTDCPVDSAVAISWCTSRSVGVNLKLNWKTIQSAAAALDLSWKVSVQAGAALLSCSWNVREQTKMAYRDGDLIAVADTFIADVLARRGAGGGGFNPYRNVELYGGTILEPMFHQPDPRTHRQEYYADARDNRIYRRVYDRYEPNRGIIVAHWAGVSD